jgi:hypothetical protein
MDPIFTGGKQGDAYLNVINLARARLISVEKQFHESNDWRLNLSQLKVINNALARYKDVHDKMDFVDMIEQFIAGSEGT